MNKKNLSIAVGIIAVIIGGVALTVNASSDNFWDNLAKIAGSVLGHELSLKVAVPSGNPIGQQAKIEMGPNLGNTYSNQFIAEASMVESTTTPCSIQNTDGVDRIIDRIDIWFNPDDPAGNGQATGTYAWSGGGPPEFDMVTSTSQNASSSNAVFLFQNQAFTTTTRQQWFVTSSFGNVQTGPVTLIASSTMNVAKQWKNNEYVNLMFNKASSSTGFCAILYHNK